jgi:hypothetical protein
MEIHHPDKPINNWRDFFIHMGTVGAGLLLAFAFERSVEAVHHRNQVHELHEALRRDSENAMTQTIRLDDLESQQIKRFSTMADQIRTAVAHHQPVPPPPPISHGDYDLPNDPAWQAAKTGGLVTLLPPNELQSYAEIDDTINNVRESWRARNEVDRRLNASLAQFHSGYNNPTPPDYSSATPEELRQLALVFYEDVAARRRLLRMARELHGGELAISHGELSLARILDSEKHSFDLP